MIFQQRIHGEEEIDQVVEALYPLLNEYKTICLIGDLGAGKTTLVKHLLKRLEVPDEVDSPTYAIVNEYASSLGTIAHIDLYRLDTLEEVMDIGLEDYLQRHICLIEWPQIAEPLLDEALVVRIQVEEDGTRAVDIMDYQAM